MIKNFYSPRKKKKNKFASNSIFKSSSIKALACLFALTCLTSCGKVVNSNISRSLLS